jgi:signal transduction histidine kinase
MQIEVPDTKTYFAEEADLRLTLEIIHRFQDWAETIVYADSPNLEYLFQSLASDLARYLNLPLVTIWDNNSFGKCLVLQASVPKRPIELAHSIPIEGTHTGRAVLSHDITYSTVLNPILLSENITHMITAPVLTLARPETVVLVINLYFRNTETPAFPISKEETRRLLSRFSTILQNQIFKRDNEIESKVRNIAASAKGISSLFDGISSDLQKITRCSFALLFSWNENDCEASLQPEGYYFSKAKQLPAPELHKLKQEKENYSLEELREYCIGKKVPYVYCVERDLPGPITEDNPKTVQCQYVAVPILSSEGKAIGVLACGDPSEEERLAPSFSSLDVHALQIFSDALSPSIERMLVTRHEDRLIKTIKRVSTSMLQANGLDLQKATQTIVETLNSEVGSLYMRLGETDTFEMKAAKGSNQKLIGNAEYEVGEGITGAIAAGETINIKSRQELVAHPAYAGKYDKEIWGDRPDQKETFLGVPIWVDGKVKGLWKVSNVSQSKLHPDKYYTDEDVQIAQVLSSVMSYAIKNQEQEERRLEQFTSLANTSLQIHKAGTEEKAIFSVTESLAGMEITGMLLSLYDPQTGYLVGNEILGPTWKAPAQQHKCHIDDDDIRATVLKKNEEAIVDSVVGSGPTSVLKHTSQQLVLPLRLDDELIGTLQFDVGTAKLTDRRKLILKAFASHLAMTISRLRSIRETFDLTNRILASSRFWVAQTISTMAVHSVHHKLTDINKQLHDVLLRRQIKENRLLLDTLGDWQKILDGLVTELSDIVTFVSAPTHGEGSLDARDVHPEIQATISSWYNYVRGHNCRIHPPELQATATFCTIPAQSFREILAVFFVNSVQAHAKNIEIKTYNAKDVPVSKNDPVKKDAISSAFCLECCDDGTGLTADKTDDIFSSSYTTKPANFGSGLGLFIARELARNAGGDIEVKETGQTKGVTFQVILPVRRKSIDRE